jgi:hypothetical protein
MGNRNGNYGVHEMNKWISVNKEMPPPYEFILFSSNGNVHCGWYEPGSGWEWAFFDEKEPFKEVSANGTSEASHWMPLPEAPKD